MRSAARGLNVLARRLGVAPIAACVACVAVSGGKSSWRGGDRPGSAPPAEETAGDAATAAAALRRQGARVQPWHAAATVGPHAVRCGVAEGLIVSRGPSGARWTKPAQVSAAFAMRLAAFERLAQRQAELQLGVGIARIQHLGAYACRPVKGTAGSPSEHARGEAIDVSAFTLRDGRRIIVARDFVRGGAAPTTPAGRFLRGLVDDMRREALFGTVLTPDHDARHHDHLHLDGRRWWRW